VTQDSSGGSNGLVYDTAMIPSPVATTAAVPMVMRRVSASRRTLM
jgi:hypothetical protein